MEDQVFTNGYQNVNTTMYVILESEEDKENHLHDHVHEDPASLSFITTPETKDNCQESSEDSCGISVTSHHGADVEDGSSSQHEPDVEHESPSSHHGAKEKHPGQEMNLVSINLEDKQAEDVMFERNTHFPPDFQLHWSQSTYNSSTSLKFPLNNNCGENDDFQEDCEIFMFVKVRAWLLLGVTLAFNFKSMHVSSKSLKHHCPLLFPQLCCLCAAGRKSIHLSLKAQKEISVVRRCLEFLHHK